ncbi:SKP1-like protein 17 [Prosopis cineraria]|uniref:SKP1-like protein 17 n=1 Tax=Prosopis cineraria TaxID=364024 RepID=UPI00240F4E2C|nr:SKP1-like protein 17 [Prosopis cineraria]
MSKRKITVKSCDDQVFVVDEAVAAHSPILSLFFTDENHSDDPISFSRMISGKVLSLAIKYCAYHADHRQVIASSSSSVDPLINRKHVAEWEYEFINDVAKDKDTLFYLTKAANYLNIEGLLNLACKNLASFTVGKTPDQIRIVFSIKNIHYKEEDEEIRKELGWPE